MPSGGPSSYGSTGVLLLGRGFFFVRLFTVFFGSAAEPAEPEPAGVASAMSFAAAAASLWDATAASTAIGVTIALELEPEPASVAFGALGALGALGASARDVDAEPAFGLAGAASGARRPSASMYAPAPASARSTISTITISAMLRFGGSGGGSESDGLRRCDVGSIECAATAPFEPCAGGRSTLGGRFTLGAIGYEAGGTLCGALTERGGCDVGARTYCALGCTEGGDWIGCAPVSIFCVGGNAPLKRAPHPPQNRESGSFSVPQLGQRMPP
jgi:hypothetical protein